MSEDFPQALVRLRTARRWSRKGLAERTGYTYQYVWEQETGRKPPTDAFAEACDRALEADGALIALATEEDDVQRRTLLGIGALAPLAAMETIRHGLTRTLAGDAADEVDLDEWDEIAWEYGHTFLTTPPAVLIRDLSADALAVQQLIESGPERTRDRYCRVAARLAGITALTWASLSEPRQAWRWWRTARVAADASGDLDTRMWCRSGEVVNGLYERRPIPVLLKLADEAVALGGDRVNRGVVSLWAGIAQANATIGRAEVAERAMRQAEALASRLPANIRETDGVDGWPEYRLHHTRSYAYSELGDTKRAYEAQDRALALYPESMFRNRAQVQLHRAACLVRDGDISGGVRYALSTLQEVPEAFRASATIRTVGRKVIDAAPRAHNHRDELESLAEALA
ncbi:MAG: helix-turn-helix transcriptional regulator [Haloechinothrix sp.]